MADVVFRASRACLPGGIVPASVAITDGLISDVAAIDVALSAEREVVLEEDEVLLPGLVDTHVHVNEPGRTEWEGFATATRAASAGGVTTLLDMPLNSLPAVLDVPALEVKRRAATGQCWVDVGFWGGAVPGNLEGLEDLHRAGVLGFKCFLADSGVPEFPALAPELLEEAMRVIAGFDGLLLVHAEDPGVLGGAPAGTGREYGGFLRSRPDEAERRAVELVAETAARTACRVHVVHVSSAAVLPVLRAARRSGVAITAETCPHYLTLCASDVPPGATQYKCCPPIRDADNQDALWAALDEGVLDLVVTDHSPATPELKLPPSGDFARAWGGIASLQVGLPVVWSEARRRGVPLESVVRWMSAAPAGMAGLSDRGAVAEGRRADLVVFAPDADLRVRAVDLHHRHAVSPYDGASLSGVVRSTWLRGRLVTTTAGPTGHLIEGER